MCYLKQTKMQCLMWYAVVSLMCRVWLGLMAAVVLYNDYEDTQPMSVRQWIASCAVVNLLCACLLYILPKDVLNCKEDVENEEDVEEGGGYQKEEDGEVQEDDRNDFWVICCDVGKIGFTIIMCIVITLADIGATWFYFNYSFQSAWMSTYLCMHFIMLCLDSLFIATYCYVMCQ